MNMLVGAKVSIVANHPQPYSRCRDIKPRWCSSTHRARGGDRAMVDAAWGGASDADEIVFLYDGGRKHIDDDSARIMATLMAQERPRFW